MSDWQIKRWLHCKTTRGVYYNEGIVVAIIKGAVPKHWHA